MRTSVAKIHPKNILGNLSQNQLIEASKNYWPNYLLGTISLILNVQCPQPSKLEFQFQLNKGSAAKNFCIMNKYNKDLRKPISYQFNSPLGYGSEFFPTDTLEVLSSRHPNWTRMKNILENGSAWPLEELEEIRRATEMKEALSFVNHKGDVRDPILLRKLIEKYVVHGYGLVLHLSKIDKIPGVLLSPMNIMKQNTIYEHGQHISLQIF